MVQLSVRLTAVSGHAPQLVEALHSLMRQARRPGGCTKAHIAADVDEANAFWYVEDWPAAETLETDLASDRFSQLLALMETSAHPPLLEFRFVAGARGLDYVTAVRAAREPAGREAVGESRAAIVPPGNRPAKVSRS